MARYCFERLEFKGYDLKIEKKNDTGVHSYPSVSAIIGQLDKSAALIPWAQRVLVEFLQDHWTEIKNLEGHALTNALDEAKKESTNQKNSAAKYGTDLHKILEKAIKNEKITDHAKDAEAFYLAIEGVINQSDSFNSELPVVNQKLGYAGCIDLYDKQSGTLYDLKTSKAVYDTHYLQLAGYALALESMGMPCERVNVLHWDKSELVLNTIECTGKVMQQKESFKHLVNFYYSAKKRQVHNERTL